MYRRNLLSAAGVGLLGALAGCETASEPTPTRTPEPAASVLRIQIENADDTTHDVVFRLKTQSPDYDVSELFDATDIPPGTIRTLPPRELRKGTYELEIELPRGTWTYRWAGYECPEKLFEIHLSPDGHRVADRCPADN